MKYFLDTEFVEEPGSIELISIGIVAEDGRKYYAISKDFDLKKAWNRFQMDKMDDAPTALQIRFPNGIKKYWIRDNVLKSIFDELLLKQNTGAIKQNYLMGSGGKVADPKFTRRNLARLIKKYGVSRDQMAGDILIFVSSEEIGVKPGCLATEWLETIRRGFTKPEFYAYYADYDWVVFCWIFGRMIDLPAGFPQYCNDLKQLMVDNGLSEAWKEKNCPDPEGKHNALIDACWGKLLYSKIQHEIDITPIIFIDLSLKTITHGDFVFDYKKEKIISGDLEKAAKIIQTKIHETVDHFLNLPLESPTKFQGVINKPTIESDESILGRLVLFPPNNKIPYIQGTFKSCISDLVYFSVVERSKFFKDLYRLNNPKIGDIFVWKSDFILFTCKNAPKK